MNTKYIFVTGGVVSGLGKGITAASLGRLLKNRGYKVTIQKFDPYINVDPGTMNPYEHGEVFVTDDGAETDLDLGHYERFINENLTTNSSVTMGKIYSSVIEKERRGDYLGKTVQVIPHITNEIKDRIYSFENTDTDIVITEVGGTVGDIEGLSIIEAIRQVGLEKNPEDVLYIHVTLLPYITGSNEIKSKPTQHSVKELQSMGIQPNIIVCRTELDIPDGIREKLSMFCNVRKTSVIPNKTADCLYAVPLMLEEEGLAKEVCNHLKLDKYVPDNSKWEALVERIRKIDKDNKVTVAIAGKYVKLEDAYISVMESLYHAGFANDVKVEIKLIDSETINSENVAKKLEGIQAVVVPGGFGNRGIEGKIETDNNNKQKEIIRKEKEAEPFKKLLRVLFVITVVMFVYYFFQYIRFLLSRNDHLNYRDRIKKLNTDYEEIITKVKSINVSDFAVIDVESFDDILNVYNSIREPINFLYGEEESKFFIIKGNSCYMYTLIKREINNYDKKKK